jgi:hypothetical protein
MKPVKEKSGIKESTQKKEVGAAALKCIFLLKKLRNYYQREYQLLINFKNPFRASGDI